ncbi:MAG: hypothetical protein RSA63_12310 [Eubacterium sp.]
MLNTIKAMEVLMRAKANYNEEREKLGFALTDGDKAKQRQVIARAASVMGAKAHRVINQFFEDYSSLLSADTDSFSEIYAQPQGSPVYGPIQCIIEGQEETILRFMDSDPGCPPMKPWTPCAAIIDESRNKGVRYPLMKTIDTITFKDGTVFELRKGSDDLDRTGMFSKLFGKKEIAR